MTARSSFLQRPFGAEPMVLINPESSPADHVSPAVGSVPRGSPTDHQQPPIKTGRLLVFAFVAALLAGVASLIAGEAILSSYKSDLNPSIQNNPSPESVRRWKDARLYSATLTFATMGGLLGLLMGLAGGLVRRSASASARAGILGLSLGTIVSAATGFVLVSLFYKTYDPQSGDLVLPLFIHGAIWSALGAVGGMVFGRGIGGQGRWKSTLVGGLVGAAVATVVYEIGGALAFPSSKTDLPLSASFAARAMAQLLVATLSSLGAVLAVNRSSANGGPSKSVSS
jgi:hypothetical protein